MVRVSIIMPVFNEEATLADAVKRVLSADLGGVDWELVLVDDGSTDGTPQLLESFRSDRVQVVQQERNGGKGRAVRAGAEAANGDVLAVLDADLEYDVQDFRKMLPHVLDGNMDAVLSTRQWQTHTAYGYWYVLGNRLINTFANVLYNAYVSDLASCLKVIRASLFHDLRLKQNGFDFDAEFAGTLLRRRARIFEVPVSYVARTREEGKKITPFDGVRYLWVLLKCRFRRVHTSEPSG